MQCYTVVNMSVFQTQCVYIYKNMIKFVSEIAENALHALSGSDKFSYHRFHFLLRFKITFWEMRFVLLFHNN